MANKTPVGRLQELCIQKKQGVPMYNEIDNGNGTDPAKIFVCEVCAFDVIGRGQGKSKKDAKHASAVDLLEQLKLRKDFADTLTEVPIAPTAVAVHGDAVSTLLDKCVVNDWPLAQFNDLQGYGAPHAPEFMVECRLASLVRIGKFKTKKGAKQIAAQQILDALATTEDPTDLQVATLNNEDVHKRIRTYRELKNSDIKDHKGILLSNRHKFFEKYESTKIRQILFDDMESPREKVHLICSDLGFQYKLSPLTGAKVSGLVVFELLGNFDCVISGQDPDIFTEILNYFKAMMNVK